jgi:hypothetical protein
MARRPLRTAGRLSTSGLIHESREVCLEVEDYGVLRKPAADLFKIGRDRDASAQAASLAGQFVTQNRSLLARMGVEIDRDFDGSEVFLLLSATSIVGAIPLISPLTARADYGLVVRPRFPWAGIGPMLAEMGWRVCPEPLRLPLLKRSERRVPPWVISFMVLARLKALLDRLDRRFEFVAEERPAPKGTVDWEQYARRSFASGRLLAVPCRFVVLRDDRHLKGAIRFSIERQLQSLETQREHGSHIHRLILFAEQLLVRVRSCASRRPSPLEYESWLRRPLRHEAFLEGLQAIEWTVEERGLAGLSDLEGIPWRLPMEQFFEAWVETVLSVVARQTGAQLRSGRKLETVSPLTWDPPYVGSQRSLRPDLLLQTGAWTAVVDAKYKRHWEELAVSGGNESDGRLREDHRHDLLQALAYANLPESSQTACCLVYPCTLSTWESLRERGRLFYKAQLPVRTRSIHIWLTAVPMHADPVRVADPWVREIRALA